MESIIQNERVCFFCKSPYVHKHHVFYGTANRKLSDKDGMVIWLCPMHHNMSNLGIHFDHDLDLEVKQIAQKRWEEIYGERKDFIRRYGKSYL